MLNSDFWKRSQSFLEFLKPLLIARWRTLLLVLLGVGFPLVVFEQLAAVIWRNEGGLVWDKSLLLAIHTTVTPQLDRVAVSLTKLGSYKGIFPVATVIALLLLYWRRWRSLAYWLITLSGSLLINSTAKELLHRVRPNLWDSLSPELDYAFPSGHAMASMTFVAALVILTWGTRWCWLMLTIGSPFVVAIAWTRLYLGVHFPSDILAGWMVAIAWAIGVSVVFKPHLFKPSSVSEEKLTVKEKEEARMEQQI